MRAPIIRSFIGLVLLMFSRSGVAQSIVVSPSCGTSQSQFRLSLGGVPGPGCNGSPCYSSFSMLVDGFSVPILEPPSAGTACVSSFSTDLKADILSATNCLGCLSPGTHTVKASSLLECGSREAQSCAQTTYSIQSSIGNAWVFSPTTLQGFVTAEVFSFIPPGPCGFVACDSVYLIQVIERRGFYANNASRHLSRTELLVPGYPHDLLILADSLDAWTTPDSFSIDVVRASMNTPYLTSRDYYAGVGRSGASRDTAYFYDSPAYPDLAFPSGIVKIVLDFELNAFCAAGEGRGQYLGRAVWHWERAKNNGRISRGTISNVSGDLSQPSSGFVIALQRYASRTRFHLPRLRIPAKGGIPCP